MPVIIEPKHFDEWINPQNFDVDGLMNLLTPYEIKEMESYEVSSLVNSSKNENINLIKRKTLKQVNLF